MILSLSAYVWLCAEPAGNIRVGNPYISEKIAANRGEAGVGNDPRSSRQFNPIKQAADYDPQSEYILQWLPELKNAPSDVMQTPWRK